MATRTWANPNGGLWSVKTNWSPNGVPAGGDDVFINAGGTYTVTLDVNSAALNSLTLGGSGVTLAVGTSTLRVSGTGQRRIPRPRSVCEIIVQPVARQ